MKHRFLFHNHCSSLLFGYLGAAVFFLTLGDGESGGPVNEVRTQRLVIVDSQDRELREFFGTVDDVGNRTSKLVVGPAKNARYSVVLFSSEIPEAEGASVSAYRHMVSPSKGRLESALEVTRHMSNVIASAAVPDGPQLKASVSSNLATRESGVVLTTRREDKDLVASEAAPK